VSGRIPLLACCAALLAAGEVYDRCPDAAAAVREALAGGNATAALAGLDERIAATLRTWAAATEDDRRRESGLLAQLFTLHGALALLPGAPDPALARWLLERPLECRRLLHALDADDHLPAAWAILADFFHDRPAAFGERFEQALAFAAVWDSYQGHPWSARRRGPAPADSWRRLLAHFDAQRDRLRLNPATTPHELGVYVVAVRLDNDEIAWARETYGREVRPDDVYRDIPWTKKLSPLFKSGEQIPYLLPNIRRYGGACYEQAYVTESVLRLQGLPATMAIGRGKRGDHAWVGTLILARPVRWDFSFGRYASDHYFKGEVEDPTAPGRSLPDSSVMLTAALMGAGSREQIELGHIYLDAARWVAKRTAIEPAVWPVTLEEALLAESLAVSPFAVPTWDRLRELAVAGQLGDQRLRYWADELVDRAARNFPDFTAEWLTAAIAGAAAPATRAAVCATALRAVVARPDLVAELKVIEGDLLLADGRLRDAIESYGYPLRRFAKDGHALSTVQERITTLGDTIPVPADRERVYLDLLALCPAIVDRDQNILRETRAIILDRLVAHYRSTGDLDQETRYRRLREAMK
jgi:hypothetical protein